MPPGSSAMALLQSPASRSAVPPLTPRSVEACKRHGVEPAELIALPFEAFREPGRSEEVARIKYERFESLRQQSLRRVNEERDRIIAKEEDGIGETSVFAYAPRAQSSPSPIKSTAEIQRAKRFEQLNSSAVHRDQVQLQAMQAKQQEEIEQMILFEIKRQRILDERDERNTKDAERAEELRREVERRRAEFAEQQRRTALEKARAERDEQKRLRSLQSKKLSAERKRAELEEARAREYRESVRMKEASIRAKAIVRQERFEASLRAKEEAAAEKRRADEEREEQRLARLEELKARTAHANALKRAKQELRVQQAQHAHEELQRRQRMTFEQREAESEERRERWVRTREDYLRSVAQQAASKREQVVTVLRALERKNEKYVEQVHRKQLAADENRSSFHQQRRERLDQQAAELSMRLFERHLTVERNSRRDEYARECLDEKLHQTDERIGSMLEYKTQSLRQRKAMADKAARDKLELSGSIEKMRLTKVHRRARARTRARPERARAHAAPPARRAPRAHVRSSSSRPRCAATSKTRSCACCST